MVHQCINIRQVPWEVLKTAAFGLGFQHLPRDLANANAWKTMFDPYSHASKMAPTVECKPRFAEITKNGRKTISVNNDICVAKIQISLRIPVN